MKTYTTVSFFTFFSATKAWFYCNSSSNQSVPKAKNRNFNMVSI